MAVSDYLKGTGSANDPYVIHTKQAAKEWFQNGMKSGNYAVLVTDIDMSEYSALAWSGNANGNLEGNGHRIKNLRISGSSGSIYFFGWMSRIEFDNTELAFGNTFILGYGGARKCSDILITNLSGRSDPAFITPSHVGPYGFLERVVNNSKCPLSNSQKFEGIVDVFSMQGAATSQALSGAAVVLSGADRYDPSKMPGLVASENWLLDGASIPRLKTWPSGKLTQAYVVKGTTKVGGNPRSRQVSVNSAQDLREVVSASSASDGTFNLNCGFYSDSVMVAAYERYGFTPVVNKVYALGDIIHPVTPNGFRYLCTKAGNSGATLPPEPWSTSTALTIGAAIFTPDPVYQPQLHGPIKPVLVDLITGQPV